MLTIGMSKLFMTHGLYKYFHNTTDLIHLFLTREQELFRLLSILQTKTFAERRTIKELQNVVLIPKLTNR